jgi:hypothetical protein
MESSYLVFTKKIVDFLFNSQVIADDREIRLSKNLNEYKNISNKISAAGVLNTRLLRGDHKYYKYYLFLTNDNKLYMSLTQNYGDAVGPLTEGDFFRTQFDECVSKLNQIKYPPIFRILTTAYYKVYGIGLLRKNISKIRSFVRERTTISLKAAKANKKISTGGVVWKVTKISSNKILLGCYDKGGIFDYYINGEGLEIAPQVAGYYYAAAYSAYCFARRYEETKNPELLKAAKMALQFTKKVYIEGYLPFDYGINHWDYKNPLIVETIEGILSKYMSESELNDYRILYNYLREEHSSEPTNIIALRYHFQSLKSYYFNKDCTSKISKIIKRLKSDQTKDGFLQDNNGNYDAADLSYHHYMLACLGRGLEYMQSSKIKEIFLKGIDFSLSMLTPDGEVVFTGRGANNIYHQASAIYAFEYAKTIVNDKNRASQYKKAAKLLFNYLEKWQQDEGMVPSAMNKHISKRMGWHHCETPYNAKIAYFLYRAYDLTKYDATTVQNIPSDYNDYSCIMRDTGYATVRTKNYYISVFSGSPPSYRWSNGVYKEGIAGIAMLGIPDIGAMLPVLTDTRNGGSSSDNFSIFNKKGNRSEYLYQRGDLWIEEDDNQKIINYVGSYPSCKIKKSYTCLDSEINISTTLEFLKSGIYSIYGLLRAPILIDDFRCDGTENKAIVNLKYGYGLSFSNLEASVDFEDEITKGTITSNPRGLYRMVYRGCLKDMSIDKGYKINLRYSIKIISDSNKV